MNRLFFLVIISLVISSCSNEPDCFIADSIKNLEITSLNKDGYTLFLRTTGLNDKENFYELFKGNPKFDVCGKTASKMVFQVHIDDTEGIPVKLIISNDNMNLIYSPADKYKIDLKSIKVEVQGPLTKI